MDAMSDGGRAKLLVLLAIILLVGHAIISIDFSAGIIVGIVITVIAIMFVRGMIEFFI